MESSTEGPHHIGPDLERPELLQPRSHLSHLRPQRRSGSTHLRVGDIDGHRPGQHDIKTDHTDHPVQHLLAQFSRIDHGFLQRTGGHF